MEQQTTVVQADGMRLDSRYGGKTVLAMAARPGELEPYIGGTLARLTRGGVRVIMAVVAVPDHFDRLLAEARLASAALGCEFVILMPEGCSRVEDLKAYELVAKVDALVVDYAPVCLLAPGSCGFDEDHNRLYSACLASHRLASFDLFCYYPQASSVMAAAYHPRAFVDITDTFDLKRDAVYAYAQPIVDQEALRQVARDHGQKAGFTYAEELDVVRLMLR